MTPTFMTWNRRWFGFWQEDGRYVHAPSVRDWLLPDWWADKDRAGVMGYLDQGATVWAVGSQKNVCHICQKTLSPTWAICTDGVWVWDASLIHYICDHGVALPGCFYDHVARNQFKVSMPEVKDEYQAMKGLDWSMFSNGFDRMKMAWPLH